MQTCHTKMCKLITVQGDQYQVGTRLISAKLLNQVKMLIVDIVLTDRCVCRFLEVAANPRRFADTNYIRFTNVTLKDAQVIQCNVTNKHGYIFTNAYLNVLSESYWLY